MTTECQEDTLLTTFYLHVQVVYIKKGCGSLYDFKMLGMMFGDVMQILYI